MLSHNRPRNTVLIEQLGRRYDDAIVTLKRFDTHAVRLIGRLPGWARNFDSATRSWAIHPAFVEPIATAFAARLGLEVIRIDKRSA